MGMFTKELFELDKGTTKFMMDEMQEEIDELKEENDGLKEENDKLLSSMLEKDDLIANLQKELKKLQKE